jgi:hypothetical protein
MGHRSWPYPSVLFNQHTIITQPFKISQNSYKDSMHLIFRVIYIEELLFQILNPGAVHWGILFTWKSSPQFLHQFDKI